MTRAERLADQEARAKARLDLERQRHAKVQQQRRAEEMRERAKRYTRVGKMLDDAGFLALSDADLGALVQLLAPLTQVPNPVAVLASLLCDSEGLVLCGVDGMAEAHASCGPCGASLNTVQ